MIGVSIDNYVPGCVIWLETQIDDFFDRGAINPFEPDNTLYLHLPRFGMGVVRDAFDMDYVRPWAEQDSWAWTYSRPYSECHCKDSTVIDS